MNNSQKTDPFFSSYVEENEFNIKDILYKYLANWKWFLISLILGLVLGFFYLKSKTPLYNIQTSILIKDDSKGLSQGDMLKQLDIFSGTKVVDNEIEILKSYNLMEGVVTNLNLQVNYSLNSNFNDTELYGNNSPVKLKLVKSNGLTYSEPFIIDIVSGNKIAIDGKVVPLNHSVNTKYGTFYITKTGNALDVKVLKINISPTSLVTEAFMALLKVEPSSKMSSVLLLSLENSIPQKGRDILDKLIDGYNKAGLEDKNRVAYNTLAFIEKRLKLVSSDLKEVEKEVETYKVQEGITDISTESRLFLESVQQNDLQLNQVEIQQSVLNAIVQYIDANEGNKGIVPATLGLSDPVLLSLINNLTDLEAKREQTVRMMKVDNPIVITLDKQIQNTKNNIRANIQTFQRNLTVTKQKLQKQNAEKETLVKTIPGKERQLVDITRQQSIKNDIYVFLLQKREETALSYASAVSDSRTIDKARSGSVPVKPVKRNIYLIFMMIGIALPVGVIYVRDVLNNKIRSRKDIEHATSTPILGEVSFAEHEFPIVLKNKSRGIISEQIRSLRTNLSFLSPGKEVQSILFTSGISGEGKSFISLNLGASLAMIGKKTVILELDMRKPKLHTVLNLPNNKGISNYLIGACNLQEVLQPVKEQDDYYIITCGPIPPNPVELLVNGRLKELFTELKENFDHIIIDAPPVGFVTDAQILEQYSDATLFLVRHDYTPKEMLKRIDTLYRDQRFKKLNLVLNATLPGGKYGSGYGYGYGYYQ